MMKRLGIMLALMVLSIFWGAGISSTPALAENAFMVTPVGFPDVEVDPSGTGQIQLTILAPTFTGNVAVGLEGIPLRYGPVLIPVEKGVNKQVTITLYGDKSLGSMWCDGKLSLVPKVGDMISGGYKFRVTLFQRIPGVPLSPYAPATQSLTILIDGKGNTEPIRGLHVFTKDAKITLNAIPERGWKFDGWVGKVSDSESETTTIIMNSDQTITAVFKQKSPAAWPMISGSVAAAIAVLLVLFLVLSRKRKKRKAAQPGGA